MSILKFLDEKIEGYYQKTGNYPSTIMISKEAEKKISAELNLETGLDLSWKENKLSNYKGIKIEIKEGILIELI